MSCRGFGRKNLNIYEGEKPEKFKGKIGKTTHKTVWRHECEDKMISIHEN